MVVLYTILGIILGLLLLILLLFLFGMAKVRIICRGGIKISASILGIRFTLYPRKDEEPEEKKSLKRCGNPQKALKKELARQRRALRKKLKKLRKARAKATRKKYADEPQMQPNPNLRENLGMIRSLIEQLYHYTHGNVKIKVNRMYVTVGSKDAAQTAIRYGIIVQLATYILDFIETRFNRVERKAGAMQIAPDYLSEKTHADIDIVFGVRIRTLLKIAVGMYSSYKKERRIALKKARLRTQNANLAKSNH